MTLRNLIHKKKEAFEAPNKTGQEKVLEYFEKRKAFYTTVFGKDFFDKTKTIDAEQNFGGLDEVKDDDHSLS